MTLEDKSFIVQNQSTNCFSVFRILISNMDIGADKLRREIQIILKDADLNTLSSKKVRQMLEALFKCDFTERKKEIDDILMAEITTRDANQTNNDEQDEEDEQVETSDDDKPAPSNAKKSKKQQRRTNHNNNTIQQIAKSDEELAMEIHQQENRPSLRHSRPVVSGIFIEGAIVFLMEFSSENNKFGIE